MGLVCCLVAFIGAFALARKGLGHGLGFVLAVGCIYGWLRANFLDGVTHFSFDAALLGLYLGVLPRVRAPGDASRSRLVTWTYLLLGWPLVVILLSPFLDAQHVFVQIAGLRNAILFVPLLVIGGVASEDDLTALGSWAEGCLVVVSGFAIAEWLFGLEYFFPLNPVTKLLYASRDVAAGYHRLPASFTSAHAYGGTMVGLLPLLLSRLEDTRGRRWLTLGAIGLASLGVFACGARSPVLLFGIVVAGTLVGLRQKPVGVVLLVAVMAMVGYTVSQSDRLRRYESLTDTEMVEERVAGSVNMSFIDILTDYPFGKGLGSAVGTSVPFFLSEYARPPVGIENEFGRLLLEEGLPGLLLWLGFLLSVLGGSAVNLWRRGPRAIGMWLVCATSWATGLIGVGLLASIPGTFLLMVYFGEIAKRAPAVEAFRPESWPQRGTRPLRARRLP